jgi:hypothetical protein
MSENSEVMYLINQARIDARSDKLRKFLNKNKKHFSRLIIIALVALVIFFSYRAFQRSQQEKFSEILHQSLIYQQIGELGKAKESLEKIYNSSSAPNGVKSLASLRLAAFLLESNNQVEALKVYAKVSDCRSCDAYVRDLGGLLMIKLWMTDSLEVAKEDLSTRIEKIENNAKPLKFHIAEQRALLELQKNNLEKSYQIFDLIVKSPEVSPALKARAQDGLKMVIGMGYSPKV